MAAILVIEDDPAIARLVRDTLTHAGHAVEVAVTGSEGLQRAFQLRPDVVISDVMLPRLDGWGILRAMRARKETARIPLIFLTQLDGKEDRLRGLELGAEDYLTKPFHPEELVLRVRNLLAHRAEAMGASRLLPVSDMAGRLEHFGLASLLSLLENERASGILRLVREGRVCEMALLDGKVVRAEVSPSDGILDIDAVAMTLAWPDGDFRFDADEILAEDRIGMGTTGLLMEAARRLDEAAHHEG